MQINSRHTDSDRGLDAYFTPYEAVVSLLNIENSHIPKTIWEPAAGNGAIVEPLESAGYIVVASDIAEYGKPYSIKDYLTTKLPSLEIQGIVTNPPFKLAIEFATKALTEVPYLALLLRTNFLESTSRLSFFRTSPPSRIWISSRRLPQMHRHGWTGPEASSNIAFAWFVWDNSNAQTKPILDWFDFADFTEPNHHHHHKSPAISSPKLNIEI